MRSNYGNADALAHWERLVKNSMERRKDPDPVTGLGRNGTPWRVPAR